MGIRRHDRHPADFLRLPFAEQFLIWSARMWVVGAAQGRQRSPVLQEGFCVAGVTEAWDALDALMWILCRHAERTPEIHGVRCPCVGQDEAMLVRALEAAQRGAAKQVEEELATVLAPEMAASAAQHLRQIAHIFLCAGLCFGTLLCQSRRMHLAATARPRPHTETMANRTVH